MLPNKIFKTKGPRLAKNAFSKISAWEKLDKNKSARSLALKFAHFKKMPAGFQGGGGEQSPLLPPTSYGPAVTSRL